MTESRTMEGKRSKIAFYKSVAALAIPIILQSMITLSFNMVNSMMMGQLGEIELAAISLCNQGLDFFNILCQGGLGVVILTAQFWGSKDIKAWKQSFTLMLRIILSIAVIMMVLLLAIPNQLMSLFSPDPQVISQGAGYMQMYAFALIPMALSVTMTMVLRTIRQVNIPLAASIVAFFVNIGVNYAFIFGNFGVPALGVRGAALGIICARCCEMVIICGYTLFIDKKVGYRIPDFFKPCMMQFKNYVSYGMPVAVSDLFMAGAYTAMAMVTGHVSTLYAAAAGCVTPIMNILNVFNSGLNHASITITGNNMGTGDRKKTREEANIMLRLAVICSVIAAVVLIIAVPFVSSGYNFSAEGHSAVRQLTYAYALMIVVGSVPGILGKGVLKGGGDTKALMILEIVGMWCVGVPLAYLGGIVLQLPYFFVYIFQKGDVLVKFIWCSIRYRGDKWMKRIGDESKERKKSEEEARE